MSRRTAIRLALLGVAAIAASAVFEPPVRLVWNTSPSAPVGLYGVVPVRRPEAGQMLAVRPPEPLASRLETAGYLPRGALLLKPVAAGPGQRVCRRGVTVTVDGRPLGEAQARDRRGRPLPVWTGCRTVADQDLFLMNPRVPDSLDGRYFGVTPRAAVVGRAYALWTDPAGDGRFVRRAPDP